MRNRAHAAVLSQPGADLAAGRAHASCASVDLAPLTWLDCHRHLQVDFADLGMSGAGSGEAQLSEMVRTMGWGALACGPTSEQLDGQGARQTKRRRSGRSVLRPFQAAAILPR